MMAFLLYVTFLCAGLLNVVDGLTQSEIDAFVTSGMVEENTGIAGYVAIQSTESNHTLTSNGVPDHDTGDYPTVHNPNDISPQSFTFTFPINPIMAEDTTALSMGPIGIAINGVALFNPYTITGDDAVLTEFFDDCDGHPDMQGTYHYHKLPDSCVVTVVDGEASGIVGVALDGFPIYGPIDEDGTRLTSNDLDECHGKLAMNGEYRYHTTDDLPYILGCFKGAVEINQGEPPAMNSPTERPPNGCGCLSPSVILLLVLPFYLIAQIL